MSQIGLCVIEDGQITDARSSLVNPECGFDEFNIMLTGITPDAVAGAPCFAELWRRGLGEYLEGAILVAHNAPFDLAVLSKCLAAYGIVWKRTAQYLDTVRLARQAFPGLPNHKLNTLAYSLGLELDHHDAASDALACAGVLLASVERGVDPARFVRTYDFAARRTLSCV